MSKKKPTKSDYKSATESLSVDEIEHFAILISGYADRLKKAAKTMRESQFRSIDRTNKRHKTLLKAMLGYTNGVEGALETRLLDISSSIDTKALKVADTVLPYESDSKKTDSK